MYFVINYYKFLLQITIVKGRWARSPLFGGKRYKQAAKVTAFKLEDAFAIHTVKEKPSYKDSKNWLAATTQQGGFFLEKAKSAATSFYSGIVETEQNTTAMVVETHQAPTASETLQNKLSSSLTTITTDSPPC